MRFLAEECIPRSLISSLQAHGHAVEWMRDLAPREPDYKVLQRSVATGLVLLTEDNDFGDLIFGQGAIAYAVVITRLAQFEGDIIQFAPEVATRICAMEGELIGHLTIIEPKRTRRRAFLGVRVDQN